MAKQEKPPKGWRNVRGWSKERRKEYAEKLMAEWEAKRAKRGWMTAEQAQKAAAKLLPKGKIVEVRDIRSLAPIACNLPLKPSVSIMVGHYYGVNMPGVLVGRGVSIDKTFTAGFYEAALVDLKAWLALRGELKAVE